MRWLGSGLIGESQGSSARSRRTNASCWPQVAKATWGTRESGKEPIVGGTHVAGSGTPAEIEAISRAMAPALTALAVHIYETRDEEARTAVLSLIDVIRKRGIEPDVGTVLTILRHTWDMGRRAVIQHPS